LKKGIIKEKEDTHTNTLINYG
jgi:hypothetical protein